MNTPGNPRKALGRGLESLLKTPAAAAPAAVPAADPDKLEGARLLTMAEIQANPQQPRTHFDPAALEELAQSIRAQGVLQPVLVRPHQGKFQLIAGERRFRAAQLAGLKEIPAIVRPFSDEKALELAIIENLQREDLNPMEQARAFQQLASRFQLTQEQVAQRTGKDRATVANFLRLLKLSSNVQAHVEENRLSMGHARALLSLDPEKQNQMAAQIIEFGWSVRQVEDKVAQALQPPAAVAPKPEKPRDPNVREAEEQLARRLGTKVVIKDKKNRGSITIEYYSLEDFQRIFELFER